MSSCFPRPFLADPCVAIAACRRRTRGRSIWNMRTIRWRQWRRSSGWSGSPTGPFGIKLSVHDTDLLDAVLESLPSRLDWVLLCGGDHPALAAEIERIHALGVQVYFEAIHVHQMRQGLALGVDGLILKGHEAAGRIGDDTTFILLQRWFRQVAPTVADPPPVWVQGGVGLNTAAACVAAGARGIVLDSQVLLSREASCEEPTRNWLRNFDGSQTAVFGDVLGEPVRVAHWPRSPLGEALTAAARRIADEQPDPDRRRADWHQAVRASIRDSATLELGPLAQDAASADALADRYRTVGGIVQAFVQHVRRHLELAQRLRPLRRRRALAASQGTRYPIVQGPMTRVSDTAAFAHAVRRRGAAVPGAGTVAQGGSRVAACAKRADRLGDLPWGVGILGFVPPEIREEQMAAILETRPPFALIAGGRPDQAKQFEEQGIPTYLHVPSPGLLRMFLKDGARRFIFEGRECGGHVGPRTSFVLWDAACEVILEHLGAHGSARGSARGLRRRHPRRAIGRDGRRHRRPLAERGVKVGVLMGTAYLFTDEAVAERRDRRRISSRRPFAAQKPVLLETGPGHAIRCVPTPYCESLPG